MILVIDGYNLLNEIYRKTLVSDNQFKNFIRKIDNYGIIKNLQIRAVFDGFNNFECYSQDYRTVSLYFSKTISADDDIKDYLYHNKHQNIAVVSSDLEIYREAVRLDIVTIQSSAFLSLMNDTTTAHSHNANQLKGTASKLKGPIYKSSLEDNPELDELMAESGSVTFYKLEESVPYLQEQLSTKKLSKADKKTLFVRKKL